MFYDPGLQIPTLSPPSELLDRRLGSSRIANAKVTAALYAEKNIANDPRTVCPEFISGFRGQ